MATRRILYFTAEDHYLYRSIGPALELEAKFTGDDLGLSAFREYLRAQRGALFAVVADLAGEDFHEEQIPYVRGADREALLARRLAQRYRDTRLAAALSLGASGVSMGTRFTATVESLWDQAMKEKALEKTEPLNGKFRRFRPGDQLLGFLNSL